MTDVNPFVTVQQHFEASATPSSEAAAVEPTAEPAPATDAGNPFVELKDHFGSVEKTGLPEPLPAQTIEPAVTPSPEPAQPTPPQMAYGGPATLPINGAPGMKPFESVVDIHNEGLMHPQMKQNPGMLDKATLNRTLQYYGITPPSNPGPQPGDTPGYFPDTGLKSGFGSGTAPQYNEGARPADGQPPIWQNTWQDASDITQGLAGAANATVLRGIHAAPKEWSAVGISGNSQPLFGHVMSEGTKDPDVQALGAIGKGAIDYYNDRYVQPFNPSTGGSIPKGIGAVAQQAMAHPLGTAFDLLGGKFLPAAKAVGRGAKGVNQMARRAPVSTGYKLSGGMFTPSYSLAGHLQQFANQAAEVAGHVWGAVNKVPKTPKWMPKANTPTGKAAGTILKAPRKVKDFASKVLLQSPHQALFQFLQNFITASLRLNTPQSVIYGGVAMLMMLNPKVRALIPEIFFSGSTVPPHLLTAVPKWLTVLSGVDKLMNKHLALIGMQDNYWRGCVALTCAIEEMMKHGNPHQFKLIADMLQLSTWAEVHLEMLYKDAAMSKKFLGEVNRMMGNYEKEFGILEASINDNVMFYRAIRHLFIATSTFPFYHPIKTRAINSISSVLVKMAESEPMSSKMRSLGARLDRDENGEVKLAADGSPMVYVKGAGLTPFVAGIPTMQFLAKMANRENMGDVELPFSLAPFTDLGMRFLGVNVSHGFSPFKDYESTSMDGGSKQIKNSVLAAHDEAGTEATPNEFSKYPSPPAEANVGHAIAGNVYQKLLEWHERMQEIPGIPSDFSTLGHAVPKKDKDNEIIPPQPATPGDFIFNKLQASPMRFDQEAEEGMNKYQSDKVMKKYRRQH